MEKVLVTGATGFIGLHCIHQLLNQGYAVNGSVRSPDRKNEIIEALQTHNTSTENLNLYTFNLTEDDGWDEAMIGCDYLLHVASPIALESHDEDFFVKPAVAGVNRALKFAKKHNIKKVVLTSSVAAIFDTMEKKSYYSMETAHLASEKLETGSVAVNTGFVAIAEAPFGGIKQSGYGREGGSNAIKDYLNVKYTHLGIKG